MTSTITRHSLKARVALIGRKLDNRRAALTRTDDTGHVYTLSERRDRLQTAVAYLQAAVAADPEAAIVALASFARCDGADWTGVRAHLRSVATA